MNAGTISNARLPYAGPGAGTYGDTSNGVKIDNITLDAYGRITEITTGATGDITSVVAGDGLTGGRTSAAATVTLGEPGTITGSSTNSVSTSSHTHALTIASGDITGALGYTPLQSSNLNGYYNSSSDLPYASETTKGAIKAKFNSTNGVLDI